MTIWQLDSDKGQLERSKLASTVTRGRLDHGNEELDHDKSQLNDDKGKDYWQTEHRCSTYVYTVNVTNV